MRLLDVIRRWRPARAVGAPPRPAWTAVPARTSPAPAAPAPGLPPAVAPAASWVPAPRDAVHAASPVTAAPATTAPAATILVRDAAVARRTATPAPTGQERQAAQQGTTEVRAVEITAEIPPVLEPEPEPEPLPEPEPEPEAIDLRRGSTATAAPQASTAVIRAWARENGFPVNDKGRLSNAVLAAYAAAHGQALVP